MVNLMTGISALAVMKSTGLSRAYRSKINVEKEISSLIPRFQKMCGDKQAHPSHDPTNNCRPTATCCRISSFSFSLNVSLLQFSELKIRDVNKDLTPKDQDRTRTRT